MSSERELEEQLKEAGNKLLEPPSSIDELLPLLDVSPNFSSISFDPHNFEFCLSPSIVSISSLVLLGYLRI